ncbi:TPA: hypothetical protein HF523_22875 [Escherichia coli]|nr:hypothetical protein [Escherichia coli]
MCADLILIIIGRRSAKSQYDRYIDRYNANMQFFILFNIAKPAHCKTYNHNQWKSAENYSTECF